MQHRCGSAVDTETRAKAGTANNSFQWWSVVQAVAWIIWRSLRLVERASGMHTFAALRGLRELRPASAGDGPPISLAAAPGELIRAAEDGPVGIYGRQRGSGRPERVAMRGHLQKPWLADGGNEVRLVNEPMVRTGQYWADLWVRSDECMNRWPADRGKPSGGLLAPSPGLSRETDDQIRDWMIRYQRDQRTPTSGMAETSSSRRQESGSK